MEPLRYEKLKQTLKLEMKKLVAFLDFNHLDENVANCIEANRQGSHHRPKPETDLMKFYNPSQTELVTLLRKSTYRKLNITQ
jgi:hypothetical protein